MRFIGSKRDRDQRPDNNEGATVMGEVVQLRSVQDLDGTENDGDTDRPQDVVRGDAAAGIGPVVTVEQIPLDEADDDEDSEVTEGVMVDLPAGSVPGMFPWDRTDDRRDPLPLWLTDTATRTAAIAWGKEMAKHKAKYHAVRTPLYAGKVAVRVPRGGVRVLRDYARWVTDAETRPLRLEAVRKADAIEHMKLAQRTAERQKARLFISLGASVPVLAGLAVVVFAAPVPVAVLLALGAASWLGVRGGNADAPLFGRAVTSDTVPPLTSDTVLRALGALNNSLLNDAIKSGTGIGFPAPITREGPGFRADIDLPLGVTAEDIMAKRSALASALRRPLGCVWPEPDPNHHEGRLILWVGDKDMAKSPAAPWPLVKKGKADLFEPIPFATDQRGRTVSLLLMFANMLIGAMPRYGKTFALRVIALAAALDPRVRLYVYELKGTGDLSPVEECCHRYHSGPAEKEDLEAAMAGLREVANIELSRRAKVIKSLPKNLCPDSKVTPELSAKKSLGLEPIVMIIDECQELYKSDWFGGEAEELTEKIIKRGPALGIILVLATQKPDSKSLPTCVSSNMGIRFSLRVMDQMANDMILGTSTYKAGIRATEFKSKDKGIGILIGHGDTHQTVRTFYLDGPASEAIGKRARALRDKAGTLTGHAAGETPQVAAGPAYSLLDDIAATLKPGEDKVWSETVCDRLEDLRPDAYRGWDAAGLANALKPHRVVTEQVWLTGPDGKGANRRGFTRANLLKARAEAKATTQANRNAVTESDGVSGDGEAGEATA